MIKTSSSFKLILSLTAVLLLAGCVPFLSPAPPAATAVQPPPATALAPEVPDTGGQAAQTAPAAEPAATLVPTRAAPQCAAPAALTPAQTEGPYFKSGSPERASLAEDLPGQRLVLTGFVLDADCRPIPGALLDFWQADSQGQYDNAGYTLRGHQFTDQNGAYRLETVVPGLYPGRTEHIHVKVQAPNGPVLTTQLYFPGVSQNDADGIYNSATLIKVQSADDREMQATFTFILQP